MKSNRNRECNAAYPIKLLYTDHIPIVLLTTLFSNVYFYSYAFQQNFKDSFLVSLLGVWQEKGVRGEVEPVGGLALLVSPPKSFLNIFHLAIYAAVTVFLCV